MFCCVYAGVVFKDAVWMTGWWVYSISLWFDDHLPYMGCTGLPVSFSEFLKEQLMGVDASKSFNYSWEQCLILFWFDAHLPYMYCSVLPAAFTCIASRRKKLMDIYSCVRIISIQFGCDLVITDHIWVVLRCPYVSVPA